jgi:hypothetical protein
MPQNSIDVAFVPALPEPGSALLLRRRFAGAGCGASSRRGARRS